MTAGWLAAATQIRARKPNIPTHNFMLDALPATTLSIYLGLGLATVCWTAHSGS